ncbi:MAG: helix-turn-helix transcriptional regulator [Oscillospiraceae bacterium]|nr:helix-turn-helix transcriptional regulator [Oscillospiraceae bacterium]
MNKNFSRIIALLRKEKGISQKVAAANLGVSQALLSHYEKAKRECGLDFVVRVSKYYGVSCDYLLGQSSDRQNEMTSEKDSSDSDDLHQKDNKGVESLLPTLNKKLIINSVSIIFDVLSEMKNKSLTSEVSVYIMASIYRMFRVLYSTNPKSPQEFFAINKFLYSGFVSSLESISKTKIDCIVSQDKLEGFERLLEERRLYLTPQIISEKYPLLSSSLFNLIHTIENKLVNKKIRLRFVPFSAKKSLFPRMQ